MRTERNNRRLDKLHAELALHGVSPEPAYTTPQVEHGEDGPRCRIARTSGAGSPFVVNVTPEELAATGPK